MTSRWVGKHSVILKMYYMSDIDLILSLGQIPLNDKKTPLCDDKIVHLINIIYEVNKENV